MKITKRFIATFLSVILLISYSVNSYAQDVGLSKDSQLLYYTGLEWDSPEDLEPYLLRNDDTRTVTLPTSVDNSALYPTPMNQDYKDCVAWAVAYAQMSTLQTLKWNWTPNIASHIFSPSFLFNRINEGTNVGLTISATMSDVVQNGLCPSTYYPVKKSLESDLPSKAEVAASLYKPYSFYVTNTQTQIKQALAEGKGVVIGVYNGTDLRSLSSNNRVYDSKIGRAETGHAICLVGYNDSERTFKFINSWGTRWGVNGYGWISYDFVADTDINRTGSNRGYVFYYSSTVDYVMGDSNLDNTITAADGRLALRYTADLETFTDRQQVLSDVDGDGNVSAADARNILNYSAGNLTKFPLYE